MRQKETHMHYRMIQKRSFLQGLVVLLVFLLAASLNAQQDPQYTQYMYNTMSVNSAYAGQREGLSITGLYRTQWVGIDGAPDTQTLGIHSPLRNERIGLGLSVVNDGLGPANETYVNANFAYTVPLNDLDRKLSFGINGGFHILDIDWSKGRYQNPDRVFEDNLNLVSPTVGAGLYLHSRKWYLGFSVPNILTTDHYDDVQESVAAERLHYFFIGGYVFDLKQNNIKLKPSFLVKAVSGAPLIADVSLNALFGDVVTLGAAWRWDDSVSGLAGFQLSRSLFIGYSYDYTTTELNDYNSGTHEIMLRFELQKLEKVLSPRFF